ncbi:proteoglycan 4-like [Lytechinus pictus]|uniref:proteoglycan 4-like n=1 Tax=Lytechinus pictus TaxID=7653 RepID=UPI0030BA1555
MSRQDRKVLFVGDSIIRNLEDYLYHLNLDYDYNVLCFPGAKVSDLRHLVKEHFYDILYEENTTHIVVHVGTNNLKKGIWEKDQRDFTKLVNTLTELFRRAHIIFSGILPRWDCEELYEKSLHYNTQIEQLCTKLHCGYVDLSDTILELDDGFGDNGFVNDGLHLSALGKAFFSHSLDLYLVSLFAKQIKKTSTSSAWIPKELKRIWTSKPQKRIDQKETSAHSFLSNRKKNKRKCQSKRNQTYITSDGFTHPRKVVKNKPLPKLPPGQHIGKKIVGWIPYKHTQVPIHTIRKANVSNVPLPAQRKEYVKRKNSERQRRRKDRTAHRRKKKKVHRWFEAPEHDVYLEQEFISSKSIPPQETTCTCTQKESKASAVPSTDQSHFHPSQLSPFSAENSPKSALPSTFPCSRPSDGSLNPTGRTIMFPTPSPSKMTDSIVHQPSGRPPDLPSTQPLPCSPPSLPSSQPLPCSPSILPSTQPLPCSPSILPSSQPLPCSPSSLPSRQPLPCSPSSLPSTASSPPLPCSPSSLPPFNDGQPTQATDRPPEPILLLRSDVTCNTSNPSLG